MNGERCGPRQENLFARPMRTKARVSVPRFTQTLRLKVSGGLAQAACRMRLREPSIAVLKCVFS